MLSDSMAVSGKAARARSFANATGDRASLGCSKHMLMFNVTCSIMDVVRKKGASLPPSILTTCWWIQFLLLNPAVKIVPTLF